MTLTGLDFRLVCDNLGDAVVAADAAQRIVYVNAAAGRLLGWAPEELVGRELAALVPARLRDDHHAGFERYATTREPKILGHPVRVPALRRDGSEVEVELT